MADTVVRLRPATLADLPFLCEMLHEANHWGLPPEAMVLDLAPQPGVHQPLGT